MSEKIVVCGKKTILGRSLAEYLKSKGHEVVMLSDDDLSNIPAPTLAKRIDGSHAICNTIGAPYVAKWSDRYMHDIYCTRMLAIRAVISAIKYCEHKPKVMMHMSNAMVYDQYEVHDDYSAQYSDSFIAEVGQMETKEALKIRKQQPDVRLVLVRCGYVMSKSDGLFPLIKKLFTRKISGLVGDGYQCIPMVHIADAVSATERLLYDESAEGIFNLTIPQMASLRELSDAFEARDHGFHLPLFNVFVRILTGRAVALLEQNCKVEPRRLQSTGFQFQYPDVQSIVNSLF
ncbi:MAG: DUF1731 domain-containing protein [Bacteroidales bacterium]|nr:DUF1731 domain-containing protein [Bacteroidales bacterium]